MPIPSPMTFRVWRHEKPPFATYGETLIQLERIDPESGDWISGSQVRIVTADPDALKLFAVGSWITVGTSGITPHGKAS